MTLFPRRWSAWAVQGFRFARRCAYRAIGPLDYFARVVNHKSDFPPVALRRYVGDLRYFEASAAEFMAYLKLIAKLQPGERVLDIGCGCGMMALELLPYLDATGMYAGVDIDKPCIEWCRRKISPRSSQFRFEHLDVRNDVYRPRGRHSAAEISLPFEEASFDVVLLKSVFTHLEPAEVDNYLKETSRLLSGRGRCLATFFLFDQGYVPAEGKGPAKLEFRWGDEIHRYTSRDCPGRAVAYSQAYITGLLAKHGLVLDSLYYGNWSVRPGALSLQDVLLLRKNS